MGIEGVEVAAYVSMMVGGGVGAWRCAGSGTSTGCVGMAGRRRGGGRSLGGAVYVVRVPCRGVTAGVVWVMVTCAVGMET